jgi:DNA-binding transcriptional MerR regulator
MAEAPHHSIGEVLSMLKEEHADVTISKIRFFESQGLIDPERTPSGYRKFYDSDIDRLRWILVQQRDNFLPLKVIKRRMEEEGFDPLAEVVVAEGPLREPTLFTRTDDAPADEEAAAPDAPVLVGNDSEPEPDATVEPESEIEVESVVDDLPADGAPESEPEPDVDPGPEPVEVPPAPAIADGDPLDMPAGSVSLSALELAESAGVDLGLVADLARLGLIETVAGGEGQIYDHEALIVAKAAGVFIARGVEPRHLRMFKVSADRESGVLEQLVSARLKKGGETQRIARAELNELVGLGEAIHRSILRRNFGNQLD